MDPGIIGAMIGAVATITAGFIPLIPWIRKRMRETNARIDTLYYYTMSEPMYENLRKLAEGRFTQYTMSGRLKRELYHLRDIGFIRMTAKSEHTISRIPPHGEDLQSYIDVTDVGRQFVEKRKALDERKARDKPVCERR
jgi:hypothetical protein